MHQAPGQEPTVAFLQAQKAAVPPSCKRRQWPSPSLEIGAGSQELRGQHRRQGERHHQRHQRGSGNCEPELLEERTNRSTHQADWGKDHYIDQRDGERGQTDFRASDDGRLGWGFPLCDVPQDVLEDDDRVIHEDADAEDQAKRAQLVQAETEQAHDDECGQEGGRDRQENDERDPQQVQEQQQDDRGEDYGSDELFLHAGDGRAYGGARIRDDEQLCAGRELCAQCWQLLLDGVGNRGGVGTVLLGQAKQHTRVAVDSRHACRYLPSDRHARYVPNMNGRICRSADHNIGQIFWTTDQRVDAQVVVARATVEGARWGGQVVAAKTCL